MIEKVLIVEDEFDIRFLLKQYFKGKGFTVLEAGSLEKAADHIDNLDDQTLVTLDVNLPDGNGFSFLDALKKLKKKCKVVVCSAYSDLGPKAIALGADDFVAKPIMTSRFDQLITEY